MVLTRLSLHHFRNLGRQELEFPREGVAVVGENAQGKSNLLESIYYLETLRSFRGAPDEQLVAFQEPHFRVVGRLEGGGEPWGKVEVAAAFQRQGRRKRVTLDGREPERLGDALGRVGAILFSPSDVNLISGAPSERRRFLDIVLSLNLPGYLSALQRYRQVLAQRNALLREGRPPALTRVWDGPLVEAGVRVVEARRRWIEDRGGPFREFYRAISGRGGALLNYRSSVPLDGGGEGEGLREGYLQALAEGGERERRMGATLVGPHRDEVGIRLEGEGRGGDLRDFGSGGQRRTAALALRLVEGDTIRERVGGEPLVLLDDVFAELDEGRSRRILELLERPGGGQVILTAPRESEVRVRRQSLPRWGIAGGIITPA